MSAKNELRLTDTNAASDSKGRTWGLEGGLFWWLVVGRDPSRWRLSHPAKLGILAIGIPVTAILGVSLTGDRSVIWPEPRQQGH